MRRFAMLAAAGLMVFCGSPLWANGGAWCTGVVSTGNADASNEGHSTDVTIEEENLTIDLHQEFAAVEVRYRMHNTGARVKQDFFFPVERWGTDLDDYHITASGKELKWEAIAGAGEEEAKAALRQGGYGDKPAFKSWKKSKIPFSGGETQEIVIRYNARYARHNESVSDDDFLGDALFVYSLSPAATWKGPIGKGKVVINILHPQPEDAAIAKPAQRFAKVNDARYEWNFQDLKPTLDDDLRIVAHRESKLYPTHGLSESGGRYMVSGNRYYLVHADYDPTASSTLKPDDGISYEIGNIKQMYNGGKTWAEGVEGDGVGESITLNVKRPLPLDSILITPGYGGNNERLWWSNNRVAQLEVTLNGEHTFTTAIPDEIFRDPYPLVIRGYDKPVRTVKLVIKGVHHGTQYQDTCISLVALKAKLAKKPKIQPAR